MYLFIYPPSPTRHRVRWGPHRWGHTQKCQGWWHCASSKGTLQAAFHPWDLKSLQGQTVFFRNKPTKANTLPTVQLTNIVSGKRDGKVGEDGISSKSLAESANERHRHPCERLDGEGKVSDTWKKWQKLCFRFMVSVSALGLTLSIDTPQGPQGWRRWGCRQPWWPPPCRTHHGGWICCAKRQRASVLRSERYQRHAEQMAMRGKKSIFDHKRMISMPHLRSRG